MSWFNRLSVGAKLFTSFLTLLFLMGVMGSVAVWKMAALKTNCNELAVNWMPATNKANLLATTMHDYRIREYEHIAAASSEEMTAVEKELDEIWKQAEEIRDELIKLCASPEEQVILDGVKASLEEYRTLSGQILALSRENKKSEAATALTSGRALFDKTDESMLEEVELNVKSGDKEVAMALAAYNMGRNVTLIVLGVNVVLGLGMAIWISRWFTGAIVEVDDISNSVAAAWQQLAAASEQLSSGAQQSAASLEETASSLEEITATVRQNADNADQAKAAASRWSPARSATWPSGRLPPLARSRV